VGASRRNQPFACPWVERVKPIPCGHLAGAIVDAFTSSLPGERIRDKISASKKKGMWMGGVPPLGYRAQDGKLVIIVSLGIFDPALGIFGPARCRRNPDFLGGFPPKPRSVLRNRQGIPRLSRVSSRACRVYLTFPAQLLEDVLESQSLDPSSEGNLPIGGEPDEVKHLFSDVDADHHR